MKCRYCSDAADFKVIACPGRILPTAEMSIPCCRKHEVRAMNFIGDNTDPVDGYEHVAIEAVSDFGRATLDLMREQMNK